ncbi:S49 family peptidase [Dyadobacter sp. CY261]|uniref:S49 family peptidase n=1 Tax=Dyadobacter sp. CY261 TaxID=2907203 RepID=UPI001F3C4954|nr:S49 family peptidase [Dyadobacter sp. CY261]MCF0071293.1 S49 family peptidase [Dyadobacter sp. CY261]
MICRCLSGQWHIDPQWMFQHADLLVRADNGEALEGHWPKMTSSLLVDQGGVFAAAAKGDTIGKGQALGVINLIGPIYKYGYYSGSKIFGSLLSGMASDDRVGGVRVITDTPGGQVNGSREIFELVRDFPKPVLTTVDGFLASAGYHQLSGSTRIVATQPTDQIGSIGTYQSFADWEAYYESMGLKMYSVYADRSTEKNEEFRQIIDSKGKQTELAQKMLTAYNNQFLADVKAGRGKKLTGKGDDPLKGRLFFSDASIENGLIDDLVPASDSFSVLSDMVTTSKKSTITMSTIKKPGLVAAFMAALKSIDEQPEAEGNEPTVESLTAQLAQATTERDTALGQVATLTTERDAAQTSVTTLTTKNTELQATVDKYGDQPGAMGTQTLKKDGDKIPEGTESKTLQQIIDELPSEKEAAAMGF